MTDKQLQIALNELVKRAVNDHVKGNKTMSGKEMKSALPFLQDLDDSDVNLLPIARMYRDARRLAEKHLDKGEV